MMLTRPPNTYSGDSTKSTELILIYTLSTFRYITPWGSGFRLLTYLSSLTQATDTSNIRLVFAAVKETILNNALKDSGIL